MKFCLASIEFWITVGFNTGDWRKSLNGSHALVHKEQAEVLVPNCENNPNITVMGYKSEELKNLLNSSEWKETEEV